MSHSNLTDSSDVQKDIIIASQNEIIKELKTQIETLLKEKGNTYSYTQNIIVQPFGKEKIEYIKGYIIRHTTIRISGKHIKNAIRGFCLNQI